ncbi:uncharacterized protein TrAFT101_003649 [Trichoderma asperellum]|uniref:Uncharacterized protein n=1 Tax=Trichoderma asperellum (strain ATCC 204424 / CBS 433.97 / NBRC 101777) TaxID=1042311 RepID=A0A2T3ZQ23_TRIA4|nr:hypothetical protein M441DRAFT_227019 [Trichoderma asperellum CBS 433.97]PTB46912.1 hypothetical protein M441DRAFT_227019 [Trichoderma asperellum CBS 433.97]UKZ87877.1 hypothetical protein TrAFT101_003649 [Trichoderma asperellum]
MCLSLPQLERPHCSVLHGISSLHAGSTVGSITWNRKKGSMLRLFSAYGRPATMTMVNHFAVPCKELSGERHCWQKASQGIPRASAGTTYSSKGLGRPIGHSATQAHGASGRFHDPHFDLL